MTHTKWEYEVHITEFIPTTGHNFDVAKWLNELGEDGWEAIESPLMAKTPSGMVTAENEPINKIVMQAFCKRPKIETTEEAPSGD